jgi:hypothetical protein
MTCKSNLIRALISKQPAARIELGIRLEQFNGGMLIDRVATKKNQKAYIYTKKLVCII